MSGSPVALVTTPPIAEHIKKRAVELLEEALADAREGKVCEVIIISKEIDGDWFHRATGTLSLREQLGALEYLKYDRFRQTDED